MDIDSALPQIQKLTQLVFESETPEQEAETSKVLQDALGSTTPDRIFDTIDQSYNESQKQQARSILHRAGVASGDERYVQGMSKTVMGAIRGQNPNMTPTELDKTMLEPEALTKDVASLIKGDLIANARIDSNVRNLMKIPHLQAIKEVSQNGTTPYIAELISIPPPETKESIGSEPDIAGEQAQEPAPPTTAIRFRSEDGKIEKIVPSSTPEDITWQAYEDLAMEVGSKINEEIQATRQAENLANTPQNASSGPEGISNQIAQTLLVDFQTKAGREATEEEKAKINAHAETIVSGKKKKEDKEK